MVESADVTEWIRRLSAVSPKGRCDAAKNLFLRGVEQAGFALATLGPNSDFRALIHSLQPGSDSEDPLGPPRFIVGVAVEAGTFAEIRAANSSPPLADVPPDQDAIEFELEFEDHVELDVLTTKDRKGSGAIARFLDKSGEGIQQVELYVRDLDRATEIFRTQLDAEPVYPTSRFGANGTRVNFFLLPAYDGKKVLIELVESKE